MARKKKNPSPSDENPKDNLPKPRKPKAKKTKPIVPDLTDIEPEPITADEIINTPFVMPERLLDQVSESSPEGFLLFTVNDFGEVDFFIRRSVDVIDSGLRKKAMQILESMERIEDQDIQNQITEQRQMPPDDFFDGENESDASE